jgi:hypothetical protein
MARKLIYFDESLQKKVVILNILMQSSNQKTNALESIIGIFLHSCKTPEKVIEALAHLGISISLNAVHTAIASLSAESDAHLRKLGQTFLVAYAYDNFDVDLKTSTPMAQKSTTTLKHLTSALVFPLQHGVTQEDMKCSEELWKKSHLNPEANPSDLPPARTWQDLVDRQRVIYPEPVSNSQTVSGEPSLTRRERFNSWKFLHDLCHHGPSYFTSYRTELGTPETIEQIPVVKTPIIPARAMEYSNSTVAGNISTMKNLTEFQGGVGDPRDPEIIYEVRDGTLYIILFHGDVGTGDRIFAIQLRRSAEKTPWRRFQFAVFVPGLFHVKMACADTIWRIFIHPTDARIDNTSLMCDVAKLRPKETGITTQNPGFRRMHQLITHIGIGRRLDCWRVEVSRRYPGVASLEDFASLKPTFQDLQRIANWLARNYVADYRMERLRRQPIAQRDQQYENALLFHKYSLFYEEITYAMNHGDIGRLELCLVPWIFLFRATGKHKYAKHMTLLLSNLYFLYPPGLSKAIRYNILVNPTGKPGAFRGVDWVVELHNLFTKVEHGGSSSNRTVDRIIKESPLVQLYRSIHTVIEKNLALSHLTTAHSNPDMARTFADLQSYLSITEPHKIHPGRKSAYSVPDQIDRGRGMLPVGFKDSTTVMEEDNNNEAIKEGVVDIDDNSNEATKEEVVDIDDIVGELA